MRVFISEFVSGGGWPEELPESLAREGGAMLRAVVADFSQLDGVRVTTTWDSRLGPAPFASAQAIAIDDSVDELPVFRELAGICDWTLIIAPEIDGILSLRARIAVQNGGRLLGPDLDAIDLCADKLQLADHWGRHGVATIPTFELTGPAPSKFPIVVKPRDGAGSQGISFISSQQAWAERTFSESDRSRLVWQPFLPGRAVSCGLIFPFDGSPPAILPPAEQRLSADGRFTYLGGRIPAAEVDGGAIQRAAAGACAAVPGLRGYVGVDLIVPDAGSNPLAVEINPRLTTSYVGYRVLARGNLARHFWPEAPPLVWHANPVIFDCDGAVEAPGRSGFPA